MTVIQHTPLSRLLTLGLLLGLLALLYLIIVVPLQGYHAENRQQLERLTLQLEGYRRIAASREQIEGLLASIRPEENTQGYYLKGTTQALASAELQAHARTLIEKSNGSLISTQPMVKTGREPERMVRVNVRMRGRIDSLLQTFYNISTGVPVVLTDDVLIRSETSTLSRAGEPQSDDTLDVQFTLTGFVKESIL